MNDIQAVVARYVETTSPGIDGTPIPTRRLKFSKIVAGNSTTPIPHDYPDSIADWCERHGYVMRGALLGEARDLAVFWIDSALALTGARPESFAGALGESVESATVAYYSSEGRRPAHLATSMSRQRVKAIRLRNLDAQDDVSIAPRDDAAFEQLMLGYMRKP